MAWRLLVLFLANKQYAAPNAGPDPVHGLQYFETMCAETPVVGEPCDVVGLDSSVECKYKVQSTGHGNFNAYRIAFSAEAEAHAYTGFDEGTLKEACKTLSSAIARTQGTDPNLKPICDFEGTSTGFCDAGSAIFEGASMSKCKSGGSECAYLPYAAVSYGVFYSTLNRKSYGYLGNFAPGRGEVVRFNDTSVGAYRYRETLCAETAPIGQPCGLDVLGPSVDCKFKVNSTSHGFTAYRISYDTNAPGSFDATTFKTACRTLSLAVAAQTGTNPNLKPLCNRMSVSNGFCDYDTARFTGTYLTQCKSSISNDRTCAGLPAEALTLGVYFSNAFWKPGAMLAAFGAGRHEWIPFADRRDGAERYSDTLCAPMPVVGEDCGVSSLDASIECKFKVTSTLHTDLTAYRINYNTQEPGRFDGTTFKSACRTLSQAIATQTGTDPNLKPLCNHMSTGNGYCDYDTARYTDAYLTQCRDDSDAAKKCLGLPFEAVTYAVFYNNPGNLGRDLTRHCSLATHLCPTCKLMHAVRLSREQCGMMRRSSPTLARPGTSGYRMGRQTILAIWTRCAPRCPLLAKTAA